ncbi:bifunctional enoyl-CoA hydratase/phosphate acetyltransferase [Glycocaulis profundi]|nr:bifunctional enoyl-CoA hydratase/phosphate acetyltransferase [Glycocaulis profundi]
MADRDAAHSAAMLESLTIDRIRPGMSASLSRTFQDRDAQLFAAVAGDIDPFRLSDGPEGASGDIAPPGLWAAALIASVIGTKLPGPGTTWLRQDLRFAGSAAADQTITVTVTVAEARPEDRGVILDCVCRGGDMVLVQGRVEVVAPERGGPVATAQPPAAFIHESGDRLKALVRRAEGLPPLRTAVAHPVDRLSLQGALDAADRGLLTPVLVGPETRIRKAASEIGADLSDVEIIGTPHSHASAARAVALIHEGRAEALMKGAIHTHEFLSPVVARHGGLRLEGRMSHVYVIDAPAYSKLLLVTDAALNITPDLMCKADIVQNAIVLARAIGIARPKVGLLAAVEEVSPNMRSTLDAAALCKMADRGQITGGLLDGPLAFDNAISARAATAKGIVSEVAGDVDILLAPDIEVGNMLAKQLDYLAGAVAAGLVMGAKVPIILSSRSEEALPRVAACALARLTAV